MFTVSYTAVSSVLYGERLGLMLDYIDPEAQHFIDCITLMFKTTSPMLYIPPGLLRQIGAKVWRDHVEAWDGIFNQGSLLVRRFVFLFFECLGNFPFYVKRVYGAVSHLIYIILLHQRTVASKTSTGSYVRRLALQRNIQESWLTCSCLTSCPLKTSRPALLS